MRYKIRRNQTVNGDLPALTWSGWNLAERSLVTNRSLRPLSPRVPYSVTWTDGSVTSVLPELPVSTVTLYEITVETRQISVIPSLLSLITFAGPAVTWLVILQYYLYSSSATIIGGQLLWAIAYSCSLSYVICYMFTVSSVLFGECY